MNEPLAPVVNSAAAAAATTAAAATAAIAPDPLALPRSVVQRLRDRLCHAILGRDEVIDLVLTALLADGHVLLEDYPGSGKTVLAKALGNAIADPDGESDGIPAFRRVQFTPDLLPSDITGVSVFDPESADFHFRRGPLFAHVVLGDEINRTSPKVQAAMLEAMAEKQVTVDNVSHPLHPFFFVMATQNPRDVAGTYPLPLPQLDRFLFKIRMEHIGREDELKVLETRVARQGEPNEAALPKVGRDEIVRAREILEATIFVSPAVNECLVDLARALRDHPKVVQGVSTRSIVLMVPALKAAALLRGREFVSAEDVEWLAPRVFPHRMELAPGAGDGSAVVRDTLKIPLEALSRFTLSS